MCEKPSFIPTLQAVVSPGRTLHFEGTESTVSSRLLYHRAYASTWRPRQNVEGYNFLLQLKDLVYCLSHDCHFLLFRNDSTAMKTSKKFKQTNKHNFFVHFFAVLRRT